uniref:USP domain-containing protein n=1 Tax=Arcella intermedia TaxID=1963864 RepID=A0A6B2L6W3_9EUKA
MDAKKNLEVKNQLRIAESRNDIPMKPEKIFKNAPSRTVDLTKGKSLRGLTNLGNTCWLNTILQCLSNTLPLTNFFISYQYLDYLMEENNSSFPRNFDALLKELWKGYPGEFAPHQFIKEIRKYRTPLGEHMKQQDAHEGFTFILDKLHDSINQGKSKTYHEAGPDTSLLAWKQHMRREDSFIWELFGGQLKSTISCHSCGKKSSKFDHFTSLSMEIPNTTSKQHVMELLAHFTKSEKVEWNCPFCSRKSFTEKKITISHLPEILVLHLKRFSQSWVTGEHRKIQNFVDFPLDNLDLSRFLSENHRKKENFKDYTLYAITNQRGSLSSGHYTAYVNRYNKWYHCNDSSVSLVPNPRSVITEEAYLLFYYRKDQATHFSKV